MRLVLHRPAGGSARSAPIRPGVGADAVTGRWRVAATVALLSASVRQANWRRDKRGYSTGIAVSTPSTLGPAVLILAFLLLFRVPLGLFEFAGSVGARVA